MHHFHSFPLRKCDVYHPCEVLWIQSPYKELKWLFEIQLCTFEQNKVSKESYEMDSDVSRGCQAMSRFMTRAESHLSWLCHLNLLVPPTVCLTVRLGGRWKQRTRCWDLESVTSITSAQSEPYTARTAGCLLSREVGTAGRKLVGLHASSIILLVLTFGILSLFWLVFFFSFFFLHYYI